MSEYRIITSTPGSKLGAKKAQVKCRFIFWTFWMDISDWRWSEKDCENDIKFHRGDISNVLKGL